jgi:ubiquinol oxidase
VHFAEEWNEFHHLLTMEALGGDQLWRDRFLAQHAALVYYWLLVALWLLSPSLSYNFSELLEAHAVDTYGEFVDANRELLAQLPAPRVARLYYTGPDLYIFDEFQTERPRGSRRPRCDTLLDVFTNIRDDEAEHVATMVGCQDPNVAKVAPRVERAVLAAALLGVFAWFALAAS